MTAPWINFLASQQDYLWFLVTLTWGLAAFAWWYDERDQPRWKWVPWSIAAGLVTGIIELASQISIANAGTRERFHPVPDLLLGAAAAVQISAWLSRAATIADSPFRRFLLRGLAVIPIAAALARIWEPFAPLGATAITVGGVVLFVFRRRFGLIVGSEGAFALVVLAIPLGSWSVLAELCHVARRWTEINPFGLVSACAQASAATWVLVGLTRNRMIALHRDESLLARKEWKVFMVLLASWVVAGIALTWFSAQGTSRNLESSIRAQAAFAALTIDVDDLQKCIGEGIIIDQIKVGRMPNGMTNSSADSHTLAEKNTTALERQLAKLEATLPDGGSAVIVTRAEDQLVGALFSPGPTRRPGKLSLRGKMTPDETQSWDHQSVRFLGLISTPWGDRIPIWTPLRKDQQMLGWLELNYPAGAWAASHAQARWQMFAITGLGLAAGTLVFIQRVRSRERALISSQAEAAAAANALKTAFLAKVSHELRTPIQTVLGYGEWLAREAHAERDRIRAAALRQHAELMLRLVNDLLDLGAIETGAFRLSVRAFSPVEIMTNAVASLRTRAEAKGLALKLEIAADLPYQVTGDPDRFNQIVMNLVGNAVKFTDSGEVTVKLSGEASSCRSHRLLLTVRDTGPGLTAAQQAVLFQPFVRLAAHAEKEGTGLGLSLVAALCRQMNGSVLVKSRLGEGAVFEARITLEPAPAKNVDRRESPLLARRNVLVAEDNALVRELFVTYLTECGALCTEAQDGQEAIAAVMRGTFDVIVLDLSMPKVDGLEVARQIRSADPAIAWTRIIGVSAHATDADRERALAAGMNEFLPKPVSLAVLARAVGTVEPAIVLPLEAIKLRLRQKFVAQATRQAEAVETALVARDWKSAEGHGHFLKNSAAAVGALDLYDACDVLEKQLSERNESGSDDAWRVCLTTLSTWLSATTTLAHVESISNQIKNTTVHTSHEHDKL